MENSIVQQLQEQNRFEDLFILARYMYASGEYLLPDDVYDAMIDICRENNLLMDYVERNADEDPVPIDLLNEFGISYTEEDSPNKDKYKMQLIEEASFSIRPLFGYDEVWEFVDNNRGKDLVLSLKVDGVFCKSIVDEGKWQVSISRGRHNKTCFDYTYAVKQVVPDNFNDLNSYMVKSELYVREDWLNYLRDKYPNKNFVGPRYAGSSLARVHYDKEDYEGFVCLVHGLEGYGNTLIEQYEKAAELGLKVVPYELIKHEDVPNSKYEFIVWLRNKLDWYYNSYQDIPSDGMVLSVNEINSNFNVNGNYTDTNVALKLEMWNNKVHCGTVTSIMVEQKRVNASCRVTIEPMRLQDGTEARVINVFNPSLLIESGLTVGSRVYYERTSNAINVLSRHGVINLEGGVTDGFS